MGASDSYNDISGVSEAVLMKKALMVEAGDVFPRTEGTVCTWVVCWRGHGPQADLVRSCARAVIADVPGPLTPGTPK